MSELSTYKWLIDKAQGIEQRQGPGAAQTWVNSIPVTQPVKEMAMKALLGEEVSPEQGLNPEDEAPNLPRKREYEPFFENPQPGPLGEAMRGLQDQGINEEEYGQHLDAWNQGLLDKSQGNDVQHTIKSPMPEGPVLNWEPGKEGRGILMEHPETGQHYLHTWPVEKTPDNPTGGSMHGEYLRRYQTEDENAKGGFEVDKDGNMILETDPDSFDQIQQQDPRIQRKQNEWAF